MGGDTRGTADKKKKKKKGKMTKRRDEKRGANLFKAREYAGFFLEARVGEYSFFFAPGRNTL